MMAWKPFVAICLTLAVHAAAAAAGDPYPSRPIRMLVPFAPGGITDILARASAQAIGEALGQPVTVENRPGANGTLGTHAVVRSDPDGYTLLFSPASTHTLTPLVTKTPYDPFKDLAPVGAIASTPLVLVTNPQVPATTVAELIAWLKKSPGTVSYGSYGKASASHLAGELFRTVTTTDIVHVAYKGGAPAQVDLIGGQIALMFSDVSAMPHVRAGKLRALAVTSMQRSAAFPELPTVSESGLANFDVTGWFAIYAPPGTPAAIVTRISDALKAYAARPTTREFLVSKGLDTVDPSPQKLDALMRAERDKWTKLLSTANVQLD